MTWSFHLPFLLMSNTGDLEQALAQKRIVLRSTHVTDHEVGIPHPTFASAEQAGFSGAHWVRSYGRKTREVPDIGSAKNITARIET